MQTKEIERVLTRISSKESLYISEKDFRIIEKMVDEGIIKPDNKGYSLTDYGKVIAVMGYETHQKKEPQEQIISNSLFPKSIIILLTWLTAVISILSCVYYLSS
ncbi:MAG TPA: hypothetical protein VLO29_10575 [Salegentibacter sp.]|nr:hypothetical protein [Salegentibacter sp.]